MHCESIEFLEDELDLTKEEGRVIFAEQVLESGVLEESLEAMERLEKVHSGIEDFYKNEKDGYRYIWYTDESREVGGVLEFVSTEFLFEDQRKYRMYDDEMVQENELIQYFQPFDVCSEEARVGFIITPNEVYNSLYYNIVGETDLYDLDLNSDGYTQMAFESRIFYGWQRVLLHHEGYNLGEVETEVFKKHMPEIFPDWTWEGFIEKYESLKLSKKA